MNKDFIKHLKNGGGKVPVSAQFINPNPVKVKPLITPATPPEKFKEKDRDEVQKWLVFCSIATTMLDTGTKMLKNKGVVNSRNAIFDLIESFKLLSKAFSGNEHYDKMQNEVDDFIFTFLTSTPEQQNRVVKFQENLINKKR